MRTFKRSDTTIGWPEPTLGNDQVKDLSDAELASYLRACGSEFDGIPDSLREATCRILEREANRAAVLGAGPVEPVALMTLGPAPLERMSPPPSTPTAARALDPEPERRTDSSRATSSGRPPINPDDAPVPDPRKRHDGQNMDHWVLPPEERAKGFVRPVRLKYQHVGRPAPVHPLRDLTDEERERFKDSGYVKYEAYAEGYRGSAKGRFWTLEQLDAVDAGCKTVTSMPQAIAESYAREPGYYGSTFCCGCGKYLPVGRDGEFVWDNTNERVGT